MSRVVKLEELCLPDQIGKYGIPAVAEEFSEDKVRYLRITDIDDYGNLLENDKKSVSSPEIEKYILKEGDIVFARTGNSTGRTYYHEERNGELAFAGFLIKFSLDKSIVNPKYLKYFTISKPYKQWVDNLSNGSTRGNINAKTFADCPIILPSREQQDYLVRVLSSLEDKIQINNQINQELEAMTKTLYDYWFVQFDFPDQNGNPYKSSGGKMVYHPELKWEIPEGWGVEKLKYFSKYVSDKVESSELNIENYVGTDNMIVDMGGIELTTSIPKLGTSTKFSIEDILISNIHPYFKKIWLSDRVGGCSSDVLCIRTKKIVSREFVFATLARDVFFNYDVAGSKGSKMPRCDKKHIMEYPIVFDFEIADQFSKIVRSIYEAVHKNYIQNQELTQLRDWLLPMLMNGQVKVER